MKQLVRAYIQKAGINLYTDTFKLLVKYDDSFILEGVCDDTYRRYARSIMEKCAEDDIEFDDYVNEIIKDDAEMKNIVYEKLILEFSKYSKETDTKDEVKSLKRKLGEMEGKEEENISEIKRLVISSKNELKKELVAAVKKDLIAVKKDLIAGQKGIVAEQKIQTGLTTDLKNDLKKCPNCNSIQCRHNEPVRLLMNGMKVRSQKHSCHVNPGGTEPVVVPWGKIGKMNKDFSITWDLGRGKEVTCNCNVSRSANNIVYVC